VRELLALVGLDPGTFATRFPHQLSGGQRQRVGSPARWPSIRAACCWTSRSGALDAITRLELQHEFRSPRRQTRKAMVFVTHDVREGLLLGTRVGLSTVGGWRSWERRKSFAAAQSRRSTVMEAPEAIRFLRRHAAKCGCSWPTHRPRGDLNRDRCTHRSAAGCAGGSSCGLAPAVLGLANVFQTIPSLALFGC